MTVTFKYWYYLMWSLITFEGRDHLSNHKNLWLNWLQTKRYRNFASNFLSERVSWKVLSVKVGNSKNLRQIFSPNKRKLSLNHKEGQLWFHFWVDKWHLRKYLRNKSKLYAKFRKNYIREFVFVLYIVEINCQVFVAFWLSAKRLIVYQIFKSMK